MKPSLLPQAPPATAGDRSRRATVIALVVIARALAVCCRRFSTWRAPPRWSKSDWMEEAKAEAEAAAWEAAHDYEVAKGAPFEAFLRDRIDARVLDRYRKEWKYGRRCVLSFSEELFSERKTLSPTAPAKAEVLAPWSERNGVDEEVREAVGCLPQSSVSLLEGLFWEGRTETEIANSLGVSQCLVSRRKRAALKLLRAEFPSVGPGASSSLSERGGIGRQPKGSGHRSKL